MGIENLDFNFSVRDINCMGHPLSYKVSYIKTPKGVIWGKKNLYHIPETWQILVSSFYI